MGPFLAFDVAHGEIHRHQIDPREFGMPPCLAADLAGGDAAANLAALRAVFDGRDRAAHRDALLLQAGLALYIAGRADSIAAGITLAGSVLDDGEAHRWLRRLERFAADSAVP
jgi:anthranilate phosphoribosyltransferase